MSTVLIIEDEEAWQMAMTRNLRALVGHMEIESGLSVNLNDALNKVRSRAWRVVSLDMRIPEAAGALVTVDVGIKFSKRRDMSRYLGKLMIYSATLAIETSDPLGAEEVSSERRFDGYRTASLGLEKYAKAESDNIDLKGSDWEFLSTHGWAKRVVEFLSSDKLQTEHVASGRVSKTAIGFWLERAPRALPPVLARHAQDLANAWNEPGSTKTDVAIRLIETAACLALGQTLVLLAQPSPMQTPQAAAWPTDGLHASMLNALDDLLARHTAQLSKWNWSGWMTPATLSAMRAAHAIRNEKSHSKQRVNARDEWQTLLPHLRVVMDLCGYWALHPLCADLRYDHNGWRAQLLASTAWPAPMEPLDRDHDFPSDAATDHDHFWQCVGYRERPDQPWVLKGIGWGEVLVRDQRDTDTGLRIWRQVAPNGEHRSWVRLSLMTGKLVSGRH